jgi:hypothetical protein
MEMLLVVNHIGGNLQGDVVERFSVCAIEEMERPAWNHDYVACTYAGFVHLGSRGPQEDPGASDHHPE